MRRKRVTAAQYVALALGLLGAVLQLSAATWHAFAQVSRASADAQIVADLHAVICHSGGPTDGLVPADDSRDPAGKDPKSDCLICNGLVDSGANALLLAPRSRGPPLLA